MKLILFTKKLCSDCQFVKPVVESFANTASVTIIDMDSITPELDAIAAYYDSPQVFPTLIAERNDEVYKRTGASEILDYLNYLRTLEN
jgi:hypothetical protein